MIFFILGILLTLLAIVLYTIQKTYKHVSTGELKRLARRGDEVAALLYKAVGYGLGLDVLLTAGIVVSGFFAVVCFATATDIWLALLAVLVVAVVSGFVLVPTSELTRSSIWLAKHATPVIAWLLERLHPVFDFVARFVRKHRPVHVHTGLYEKADIIDLLEKQKDQADNRIAPGEIALLQHSLSFGDKLVSDALTPKRVVKMVSVSEDVGPVLMSDLHTSGHSRFPVYDGKKDNLVGILYLHDLVGTKRTGKVQSIMSTKLTYVHEDFSLYQTLQAFIKTKHHLFIVVNSFEEFVGIITIEDVLEQMIGKLIVDEFDRYDDLRAVATAAAKKEHQEHAEPKPEATAETTEVVK